MFNSLGTLRIHLRVIASDRRERSNLLKEIASSSLRNTPPRNDTKCYGLVLILTIILVPQLSWAASKASDIKQGNLLYNQQKYAQALEKYNSALAKAPESVIINFNTGSALYKNGEYEKAILHFEKSLLSDDPQLQFKGHYNLGNAMYKSGIQKEKTDLPAAIQSLQQSLPHYEKFLALHPEDEDAKFNEAFVKKELERLEKKRKEQNKQDQTFSNESKNLSFPNALVGNPDEDITRPPTKTFGGDNSRTGSKEDSSGLSSAQPDQLSREEAKMLLENYSQNEEPKGLLNLRLQKTGTMAPVLKDW